MTSFQPFQVDTENIGGVVETLILGINKVH